MQRQRVEGDVLVDDGILSAVEVHVGDERRLNRGVVVALTNHHVAPGCLEFSELFRLLMQHGFAGRVVFAVVISGEHVPDVAEGNACAVESRSVHQGVDAAHGDGGLDEVVGVAVVVRAVPDWAVFGDFRFFTRGEAGSVAEGDEALQQTAVARESRQTVQIERHTRNRGILCEGEQLLLRSQLPYQADGGQQLLIHAAVHPSGVANRHVLRQIAGDKLAQEVFRFRISRHGNRDAGRHARHLLHLVNRANQLDAQRRVRIHRLCGEIRVLCGQVVAVGGRHVHVARFGQKTVALADEARRMRRFKHVDGVVRALGNVVGVAVDDGVRCVDGVVGGQAAGNVRADARPRRAVLQNADE